MTPVIIQDFAGVINFLIGLAIGVVAGAAGTLGVLSWINRFR